MKRNPLISVIIPTYNRKNCIMDAINSILSQKNHSFSYEIVVSDDGSTDGTSELFRKKSKHIVYFWHKNTGVNGARNRAIKKAKGDLLLFLDSDDLLVRNAFYTIEKNLSFLQKVNFFGTIRKDTGTKMYFMGKNQKYSYKDWLEGEKIKGEFLPLVHKDVIKIDVFDESRFCFESFFWNKVIKKHGVYGFDIPLRLYSFEQDNRVTKDLFKPQYLKKRLKDYESYLTLFREDYISLGLFKSLFLVYLRLLFYSFISLNFIKAIRYSLFMLKDVVIFKRRDSKNDY